jgi:L-ascorbate metabolism protein UlaG (beta-lactamase superfamily)
VLLEIGQDAVLTDPYFDARWFLRLREPIGLRATALPRLAAILGGHGVLDHWQPASLAPYPFKAETPVFVATPAMRRKALAVGFSQSEVLPWGATRVLSPRLGLEAAAAQTAGGMKVNNYVLSTDALRIFVGTEARDLEPLRRYRAGRPPVDVALLPVDGSAILGHRLVMSPADAIEASRILGARLLVPIHYALKPVPLLLQTPGSCEQLLRLARDAPDLQVIALPPGRKWTYEGCG